MANQKSEINIFDEKILAQKIAEEEKLVKKLESDMIEYQKSKKKYTTDIRAITHKIRTVEERLSENGLFLEKLMKEKEKYVPKGDKETTNKLISENCELAVDSLIGKPDPNDMQIEVEFEGQKTVFKIQEHLPTIKKEKSTEKEPENNKFSGVFRRDSLLAKRRKKLQKKTETFVGTTFSDMKLEVAPFFSLPPESFFFADARNMIFLDNLPIRTTLFPCNVKLQKKTTKVKIILVNNYKYHEIIDAKCREIAGEDIFGSNPQREAELLEAYDNEQAKKLADQKRKEAAAYQAFKDKIFKIKGFFTSFLYMVLILMWLTTKIIGFDYNQTSAMMRSMKSTFQYTFTTNTAQFYTILKDDIFNPSSSRIEYGFFKTTYLMPNAEVVITRYAPTICGYTTDFMRKYYQQFGVVCTDFTLGSHTEPFQANGVTYYYNDDPKIKVRVPTQKGYFNNLGYRLPINFSDPNMQQKITNFVNTSVSEFVSFNAVFYNPSLQKLACTYRIVYRYNQDKTNTDQFIYVFNVQPKSQGIVTMQQLIILIAIVLILGLVFDIVQFVPKSKVHLDLDVIWIKKKKKSGSNSEDDQHTPNCKFFPVRDGFIKIFPPSPVTSLNFFSVVMNIVVMALDIAQDNATAAIDLTTGNNIDCPSMVDRQTTNQILIALLVFMMMAVLLRYIAQYVPPLEIFILMIKKIVMNTISLGVLILWFFLSLSLFGIYTFGSFFPLMDNFVYFYAFVLLLVMKRNIITSSTIQESTFNAMDMDIGPLQISSRQMGTDIGLGPLLGFLMMIYILITFIIVKIITSIVIRAIKDAKESRKLEHTKEAEIRELSLRRLRDQYYEDQRAAKAKIRTKIVKQEQISPSP